MPTSAIPNDSAPLLAEELRAAGAEGCSVALVLGSGLGSLSKLLKHPISVGASELAHLPGSRVEGHAGRMLFGELSGVRVLIQQGRIHMYEGWQAHEVTRAVRAFALLGIKRLLLTNAAGCLRRDWSVGGFMRITDHLNLQAGTALQGQQAMRGQIYDTELGALADEVAKEQGMALHQGIYAGLPGPSYETPAEICMLRSLGAQAVGMSTVAEAAAAREAGMRVLGFSCLTNHAAGIEEAPLNHGDVVLAGAAAAEDFIAMCTRLVPRLMG